MSFDVNVLSSKPVIKAASSMQNDGGGGNLGYMAQGRKKDEKKYLDESIFLNKQSDDILGFDRDIEIPEENFTLSKFFAKIMQKIKNLFG